MKLLKLLLEQDSILIPRRSREQRSKEYIIAIQKKIQQYIKDGSKGDLDLSDTPITSLPDGLKVGGTLSLFHTPIQSLPNNLTVGIDLYLMDTPIQSLPNNLTVGGYLHLSDTLIQSLPNSLKVGKSLWLKNTPISKKYSEDQINKMVPGVKGGIIL